MWIIFTVFFMLFLLSNEEKQRRESNSTTSQEQNRYDKEKAMAAWPLEISQAEAIQIVAVSVTGIQASRLDNGLNIDDDNMDGDLWEDAE